jgi:hypothetical protein
MVRAADDYTGGGLAGIGSGSEDALERIRVVAILHFGYFLTAFAALGLGAAASAEAPGRPSSCRAGWVWRGLVAGGLLLLTPVAGTVDVLFLPFFFGTILTIVGLLAAGLSLAVRPPRFWPPPSTACAERRRARSSSLPSDEVNFGFPL